MSKSNNIHALEHLKTSEGWKMVLEWIEAEIKRKENRIFSVKSEDNSKEYTAKDTFIFERSLLLALKELPDTLSVLQNAGLNEVPTVDEVLEDINKLNVL